MPDHDDQAWLRHDAFRTATAKLDGDTGVNRDAEEDLVETGMGNASF